MPGLAIAVTSVFFLLLYPNVGNALVNREQRVRVPLHKDSYGDSLPRYATNDPSIIKAESGLKEIWVRDWNEPLNPDYEELSDRPPSAEIEDEDGTTEEDITMDVWRALSRAKNRLETLHCAMSSQLTFYVSLVLEILNVRRGWMMYGPKVVS
eukprot:747824-Hanusia_phi.AAC.2